MSKPIIFQQGLSTNLDNLPMTDGQIIFTTDDKRLYLDIEIDSKMHRLRINADADTAIKAFYDSVHTDKTIAQTYFSEVSVNGSKITFTKGDGSTAVIDTKDTVVVFKSNSTNQPYPLIFAGSGQTDGEIVEELFVNDNITINPSTKTISADLDGNAKTATLAASATKAEGDTSSIRETYFSDISVSGKTVTLTTPSGNKDTVTITNATTADKLGTSSGSATVPVYFSSGKPVAVTGLSLDTTGKAASADKWTNTVNFQIKDADNSNEGTASSVDGSSNVSLNLPGTIKAALDGNAKTATTASKLSNTSAIGSSTRPVYFSASGVPIQTSSTLGVSITGNAKTATKATSATTAETATKAVGDELGENIRENYASKITTSGTTLILESKTGAVLSTVTTQDTNDKVAQNLVSDNAEYPLLLTPKGQVSDSVTSATFDSGVTLNPSTNTISAHISGNAATATSATTAEKAIGDENGDNLRENYAAELTVSGKTLTLKSKNGAVLSTVTTQDTDTKVTQTVTNSTGTYPLLLAPSGQTATKTTTSYFDSDVTLDPISNTISASITGNAATSDFAEEASKATYDETGTKSIRSYLDNIDLASRKLQLRNGAGELKKEITLPTDVKQNVTTSSGSYPILLSPNGQTSNVTAETYFDSGVTLNPANNTISASISGNAATADSADFAMVAAKAGDGTTNDPNPIRDTYVSKVEVSGRKLTFTTPSGTKVAEFNTQDTDTKVTQNLVANNSSASYPVLLAPTGQTGNTTTTSNFTTELQYTPSTNKLSADISGNAETASLASLATIATTAGDGTTNDADTIRNTYISNVVQDATDKTKLTFTSPGGKTIVINTRDNNTDTKVTQTVTTSSGSYPLLLAPTGQTATKTTATYFDSGVTLDPSTNTISAHISGEAATAKNASYASVAGTEAAHDSAPIRETYYSTATISGNKLTLGTPLSSGATTLTIGKATVSDKLGTSNVGDTNTPIYLEAGVPKAVTGLDLDTTGKAAKADKLTTARNIQITDGTNTGSGIAFDGSAAVQVPLPKTIKATLDGNITGAAAKLSNTSAIGSTQKPVFFNASGLPEAVGESLDVDILGTANSALEADKWSSGRNFQITDADGTNVGVATSGVDGSADVKIKLPGTIKANLSGKATSAGTADKLSTSSGSNILPVYFSDGKPVAVSTTSALNVSVSGNAGTASKLKTAVNIQIASSDGTNPSTGVSFDGSSGVALKLPTTIKADITGKAAKLSNTSAIGGATQPVYFSSAGVPVATTYTLGASVPSGAKFTDTTYSKATTTADGLMSKEDKQKLNYTNVAYGTCDTAAATAEKVITINDENNQNWALVGGAMITVIFTNTNTAQNPKFNVNGTGARDVYYTTTQITTKNLNYAGYKNRPMTFVYDGAKFIFVGWGYDGNTDTKVTQNPAITTSGEYPILLAYSTATTSATNVVNKTSTLKYNPSTQILTAPYFSGALKGHADSATYDNGSGDAKKAIRSYVASGKLSGTTIVLENADGGQAAGINIGGISITGKANTAGTAEKLGTNAGSATLPVYFSGGVPVATSTTLGVSITGNASSADKWKTGRNFQITDGTNNGVATTGVDGSTNVTLNLPKTIKADTFVGKVSGTLFGTASHATSATSATTAEKLSTSAAGSATLPVYFSGGKPVKTSTTLGVSITGNAASATKATHDASGTKTIQSYIADVYLSNNDLYKKDGSGAAGVKIGTFALLDSNGKLPMSVIPSGATPTLKIVASLDAMKALTKNDVQNGDVVLIDDAKASTKNEIMYYVYDDTKLATSSTTPITDISVAYKPFAAGLAEMAVKDSDGNSINATYGGKLAISSETLKLQTPKGGDLSSVTIPDKKVTQTVTSSAGSYPLLLAPKGQTATTRTTSYFDSGVTLDPSTNTITASITGNAKTADNAGHATTADLATLAVTAADAGGEVKDAKSIRETYFSGVSISGNQVTFSTPKNSNAATITIGKATVADKLAAGAGSTSAPIFINANGIATPVTSLGSLNTSGNAKTANTWKTAVNFQIKDADSTNAGTAVSVNGGSAVVLKLPSTIKATLSGKATSAGTADKLGTNAGSATVPVYFSGGKPVAVTSLSLDTTGKAASAGKWTSGITFEITDSDASHTGSSTSGVDGSANVSLALPETIKATLEGNALSATTASKLSNTSAIGSKTLPVYFSSAGVPVATSSTLGVSITGNAKTATHATSATTANSATKATKDSLDNVIKDTYYSTASISGTKLTLGTPGNNTKTQLTISNATTASKLSNTSAIGSTTLPVYFSSDGVPVATSSTLGVSITGKAAKADKWTTGRNFQITDASSSNSGAATSGVDGSANVTLKLPSTIKATLDGSASKLTTSRTIDLGTAVDADATAFDGSKNITIPITNVREAYLTLGGKSLSGSVSPIDFAASYLHSANRFQFSKPDGITIEYSRDGGSTWTDYALSDDDKVNLVSGIGTSLNIGKTSGVANSKPKNTINDKLRITLNATDMGVYTRLQKLLINISTNYAKGSNVIIEKAMKGSLTTFTTVGTYSISGWSGWNSIPIGQSFGGGATQTSNIAILRLTFGITGVHSTSTSNLCVLDIIGLGDTYWNYPSDMAKTGHLYKWNANKKAIFPGEVSATKFSGPLTGNVTGNVTGNLTGKATNAGHADSADSATTAGTADYALKLQTYYYNQDKTYGTQYPFYAQWNSVGNVLDLKVDNYKTKVDIATYAGTGLEASTDAKPIRETYFSKASVSGKTLTLERPDGSKVSLTTQDTNTDTKVNVTLGTETKAYLLGTSTTPTSTAAAVTSIADTGVYLDTTAGQLVATKFKGALVGNANSATKATYASTAGDGTTNDAKSIRETYFSDVSVSGKNITLTSPGGKTKTITTQDTDTKVNVTLGTTTKAYLLGTSTTPTSTAKGVTTISDTGVYLDTTAGQLVAKTFKGALSGNASTATKATQDESGNNIKASYASSLKWNSTTTSDTTLRLDNKNGAVLASVDLGARLLELTGGTMSGLLKAHGGIALNSSTAEAETAPEYILGIKPFTEGGNVVWKDKDDVVVGKATKADTWTTARNFQIKDTATTANVGTAVSVNGSAAVQLPLPTNIQANSFNVGGKVSLVYNTTDECLEFNFS